VRKLWVWLVLLNDYKDWNKVCKHECVAVTNLQSPSAKNKLDNHWASHSQELRYDWEAELSGTGDGNRSRVEFWVLRVLPLHLLTRSQAVDRIADSTASQHLGGHVTTTSSVTWPFDSPYAISYWWSFGIKPLSLTVAEIFNVRCNTMVGVILIRPLNKGQGHSFLYQSISHVRLPIYSQSQLWLYDAPFSHNTFPTDRRWTQACRVKYGRLKMTISYEIGKCNCIRTSLSPRASPVMLCYSNTVIYVVVYLRCLVFYSGEFSN